MKKSKYTYLLKLEAGPLLMYNSLKGTSSFIKFYGDDIDVAIDCVNNPDQYVNQEIYSVLTQYGFLVRKNINEDLLLTQIAWEKIFNPGLNLIIMPTEDCNFRCSYCYEEHKNGVMSVQTADSIIKYVSKNIAKHTDLHVVWFGGEPLMSKETIDLILHISNELIKICTHARKRYNADIITNGYNLTYPIFEQLLQCKITSYQVTIDGPASTHDRYRFLSTGEQTFNRIIANLTEIKGKCRKRYFNITIRANITSEIEETLNEYYRQIADKFSNDSRFLFFFRPVGNWGGDSVKDLIDCMYDPLSFRNVYKKIINMKSTQSLNFGRFVSFYNDSTCSACYKNSYIIGYDGKIYKCSCHFDECNNEVGQLTNDGKMDIDLRKLQMWVKKPNFKEKCKSCFFSAACLNMSCPIYSNNIRSIESEIDDCPYEKKYINETLTLLDKGGYFRTIHLSDPSEKVKCK